ncbi:MAG: methionine--tRNA ligase [Endomicrobiales bacterium]|nr:methionine--tRNA ligase [Endomicrobiales bacterium]
MKKSTFYITTPIYYVNDSPHIGHAYTTIACDILARWHRLKGLDVFYLTGTDEHGAKILEAAKNHGQDPKAFCDKIAEEFKSAWKNLRVTNDSFIRTTDPQHEKTVQDFLDKLFRAGTIYKGKYEGLYCVQCEKFLLESDLVEGLCPDHKSKPKQHSEENHFFALKKYREELIDIISSGQMQILPPERKNEILGKLKTGLEDISISRAALEWGIPLPFDKEQTAYVWVDALLNYISGIGYGNNSELFNKFWPANLHLMAKDILWFHTIIWPSMLMAAGLPLPKKVFAHGFFTINGDKMSKTLGNVILPHEMTEKFGVDATRYLTVSLFPFGSDGDISWQALIDKYNSELANNLGNLAARTLTMVHKYNNGLVPDKPDSKTPWSANILTGLSSAETQLENLNFYGFSISMKATLDKINQYIEDSAPWKMAKENNPNLPEVLFNLIQSLGIVAVYLLPFMPEISRQIWDCIGETGSLEDLAKEFLKNRDKDTLKFPHPGNLTKKSKIMFPRIDKK